MKENQEKKEESIIENLPVGELVVENYSDQSKKYQNLTDQDNKILSEINVLLKNYTKRYKETHDHEFYDERQRKIISFMHELEDNNLSILDYILGHRLLHSTPDPKDNINKLDTPNHDIEKFIRNLKMEK